jgi:hypothetical protein
MSDRDRDGIGEERVVREPIRERETTVIHTDGGGGGGGGAIAAIVLLILAAVLLFLFFGGYLNRAAEHTDINVNVQAPDIQMPEVDLPEAPAQPSNSG